MNDLAPSIVEGFIRWYVENGGCSGSLRPVPPELSDRRTTFSEWGVRDLFGVVLASCPHGISAGNPFRDDARITAVERAVIAEIAYDAAYRWVCTLERNPLIATSPEAVRNAMADCNLWGRMVDLYRSHPTYPAAMAWLAGAFGRLVFGDAARGLRGDSSLLAYVSYGGLDNLKRGC